MTSRVAAALLLAITGPAYAAETADKATILQARDEVFARPEFYVREKKGKSFVLEAIVAVGKAVAQFKEDNPRTFTAITVILVLTLLVLIAHIVWTLAMARRAKYDDEPEVAEFDIRRTAPQTFRDRAVALARKGRYEDAVRELYSALVLTLDARGDLAYARHKALLDYRMEVRERDARDALDLFAGGYHPASFGRRALPQERFEALLEVLDGVSP